MKNLSKRTKTLLAIAGVVIVVVVAGLVVVGPGEGALFGTTMIHISPENPATIKGAYSSMSINSPWTCEWETSDQNTVQIHSTFNNTNQIQLEAKYPGSVTITARCGAFKTAHTTTVTVRWPQEIIPNTASVIVGQTVRLTSGNDSCQWSASTAGVSLSRLTDGMVAVTGTAVGDVTVNANCDVGSASAVVHVITGTPVTIRSVPVITPATTTMSRGAHATWSTGDAKCIWFVNSPYLSLDTANTGASITALAPTFTGTTTVWAKCPSGWAKPAAVTVQ